MRLNWLPFYVKKGRRTGAKSSRFKRGGGTRHKQNYEENLGYYGPIMDPKTGKLDRDEICHNCTIGAYQKGARRFCKIHGKVWDPKSNSCRDKSKKARTGKKERKKGARTGKKERKKGPRTTKKRQMKGPRTGKKKTIRIMRGGG